MAFPFLLEVAPSWIGRVLINGSGLFRLMQVPCKRLMTDIILGFRHLLTFQNSTKHPNIRSLNTPLTAEFNSSKISNLPPGLTCRPILAGLIALSGTSDGPFSSLMQHDGTTVQAPLCCRVLLNNQLVGSILISWGFLFLGRVPWNLKLLALVPPKHSWRTLHYHSCGAESPVPAVCT